MLATIPQEHRTYAYLVTVLLAKIARGDCSLDCAYDTENDSGGCGCSCGGRSHGQAVTLDQARVTLPAVTRIIRNERGDE